MAFGMRGATSTISRLMAEQGFVRSDCPAYKRYSRPETCSTGYIVWQHWDGRIMVRHNLHADDRAAKGGGAASHVTAMLRSYAAFLSRMYTVSWTPEGDALVVGDKK